MLINKNKIIFILAGIVFLMLPKATDAQQAITAAHQVLERILGRGAKNIRMIIESPDAGSDFYEYQASRGRLQVKASSADGLTRGVYDYLRSKHLGMLDWAGNNFTIPVVWPDAPATKVVSPFKIRQAHNVVTAGYTTPYWTWERWEQELDWQMMHGFNMLLAPVATEAIATRVWKKMGLTKAEIDSFYVGPSLLPWQRMGNIQSVGGTLPAQWHKDQIALQHKLLKRMRELGIKPVVQSFAGFVPKGIKRLYPDLVLHNTLWNAGFPVSQRPVMLMPGDALFARITKMYMHEWQKEFGRADYYLVDSFNELEFPKTGKPAADLLAEYGKFTYDAIRAANPDAIWVIQGWMFGYQRKQWPPENVRSLFSRVPDDKVLILDYANDYANSWEPVDGFNGKQWVYGFVPNMGGKTAYTGDLNLYATGAANTLNKSNKNNLVGFSISGEGLENNVTVYELLTDAAWSGIPIDLDVWLKKFSINRYGAYPDKLKESWDLLRKSSYGNLVDHPQFSWQTGGFGLSRVNRKPEFFKSVELFLSCSQSFKQSKNYEADALERAALVLGLKAEEWFAAAAKAYTAKDTQAGDLHGARGLELLTELDRLMESHPLNRLERWVAFASAHTDAPMLKKFYEANARRIVTVWGPPVNDYSCRMWSGLVRDFYRERMRLLLESRKTGKPFDSEKWQLNWVEHSEISKTKPYDSPVEVACRLVDEAIAGR